ncbi:MAG TPA: DHA2 family efflux MFS transporter permease subunit [Methanocorpusculum sp.]|nr:DHA2 family efflux MFS transporter permease subunit [Methanocorpusculum sp.]
MSDAHPQRIIERRHILLLIAVFIACLMDGLDGSIVTVALPILAETFGTDTGTVSWISVTYLLMVAGTVLIFGRIASLGHIKKIFIIGFTVFTVSSLFCGLAPSLGVMIAARVLQGLGASMLVACTPIICVKHLPTQILGLSFGVITAASSIGFTFGPALGGVITNFLSWHWIFWINIPIGIIAIIYALRIIPRGTPEPAEHRFDVTGAILIFAAMVSLTYVLELLPHLGLFDPQIIIAGIFCIAAFVLFAVLSLRKEHPLFNLRIFKVREVSAMFTAFLIIQVVIAGQLYLLPFYFTNQFGMEAFLCGLLMLVSPLVTAILSVPFGRWSDTHGRRIFCTVSCIILTAVSAVLAILHPEIGILPFILTLICSGVSIAMSSSPVSGQIVDHLPKADKEMGSTFIMTCIYMGAVIGTAFFASIFTFMTTDKGVVASFADLSQDVFASGFTGAMFAAAGLSAAAVVLCALVKDKKRKPGPGS